MTDWLRFGCNDTSDGKNTAEDGTGLGNKIKTGALGVSTLGVRSGWPYATGAAIWAQVCVSGSYAYVGSLDGYFYKLNADTGALITRYNVGSAIYRSCCIVGTVAYVGANDGKLWAFDISGAGLSKLWESASVDASPIQTCPIVVSTRVIYGSNSGKIRACNTSDGSESWAPYVTTASGGFAAAASGALSFYNGHVYAACATGVVAIVPSTGAFWKSFRSRGPAASTALQSDGTVEYLVFASIDNYLYAYDADSGARIWMNNQSGKLQCPVGLDLAAGFVMFGTRNFSFQPTKRKTGMMKWKKDGVASGGIVAGFSVAAGLFFGVWPPNDGRLCSSLMDQSVGGHNMEWKFGTYTWIDGGDDSRNKGWHCAPSVVNHRVYWADEDGKVWCFS